MTAAATAQIPKHVAIIMDGNGRWAEKRGMTRVEGHKAGAEAALRAVEAAIECGIQYVTLFSFSSENWSRPIDEVNGLMSLLRYYLKKETAELHKAGARLRIIGDRARLSADIVQMIEQAEEITKDNRKITVVIALSYGGRQDIAFAARQMAADAAAGRLDPGSIDEKTVAGYLMTDGIPDPDLMIRTSGEYRVSNFLMWQIAYAELFFTDTLWPDFSKTDIEQALQFYAARDRRYGGLSKKMPLEG